MIDSILNISPHLSRTWNAASIAETLHDAKEYGFEMPSTPHFNLEIFKKKRDDYVTRLNAIYGANLEKSNVTVVKVLSYNKNRRPNNIEKLNLLSVFRDLLNSFLPTRSKWTRNNTLQSIF